MLQALAVMLLLATAGGQDHVIHDGMARDVEGKVRVMAEQPHMVMQIESQPLERPRVVKTAFNVVQAMVTSHGLIKEPRLFQFLVQPVQSEILLPSPQLPASCGPIIVSLVSKKVSGEWTRRFFNERSSQA